MTKPPAAAAPPATVTVPVDKRPVPQERHLPDWIHSRATLVRRKTHAFRTHWSVIWIGWSSRGWWHIARVEKGKLQGNFPHMIRTAAARVPAVADTPQHVQALSMQERFEAKYQAHKRKYWIKRGVAGIPAAGVGLYGMAELGVWVAALYAVTAVTYGAWKGRPQGADPGKVEIYPEDGDPFPIADARNRTEAAECVRRALASEGISVASVEVNKRHEWGWEVTAKLAKGKPADIIGKAPDLETPLDLPENGLHCQPVRKSRGRVVLRLVEEDPFKNIPPAPERKPNSRRLKDKQLLAMRMDGQEFKVSLLGMHVIVIAKSGGGKSIILRDIADAMTACSDVLVGDLDPGGNGVAPLAEAMGVRAIGEDNMGQIEAILEQALKIAKGRPPLFHGLGMKENWEPSKERPAIVLIGDEFPSWSDRAKQLAIKILRVSRKSRVQLVLAATEATKDALLESIANLFHLKIVGPCRGQDVTQVFGSGALGNGWRPDRLDPAEGEAEGDDLRDASQAYIRGGGSQEPIKFKFLFLEDREGRRRAKERAAAGRPTVDAESLEAAGLDHFGATEADRLRADLPQIVMMTRGAFAVADDPKFMTTLAIWDYLAQRDPETWALKLFGDDELKARRTAAQKVSTELKKAVDELELAIDMTTAQITGGARGYYLETIKQITGESLAEAA
jgi:S-DNA-T family DNA segregation ATPase FtsK/SpoIIIE